jgi:cell wall assembly regulator SMI1
MSSLRHWLSRHAPRFVESLANPVSDKDLRKCQELLGRELPADYVAFLSDHNGQRPVGNDLGVVLTPIFSGLEILGLEFARSEYSLMLAWPGGFTEFEARGPVRALYAHKLWWPITLIFGSSHHHCIDLDPAEGGDVGQIIVADAKDYTRTVIAPSFTDFIDKLLTAAAESGFEISDDGIVLADDVLDWLTEGD